jgi:hypothetical protein
MNFIPTPTSMMIKLTLYQANDIAIRLFQLHHYNKTYQLSSQRCHKHMKTVSLISAPATMQHLPPNTPKMPQSHGDSQHQSSSSHYN